MDIIKPIIFKKAGGVYQDNKLDFIYKMIENQKYEFEYYNIELNQSDNETKVNFISPTGYYENYVKLNDIQPEVPRDAKENQILNFYSSLFTKYNDLSFDPKTFLYNDPKNTLQDFETEAILLSSLLNKSNTYKDFDKPYASIEFYVDNQKNGTVKNYYLSELKTQNSIRIYLKRFVKEEKFIKGKKTKYLKDYKSNDLQIYQSFEDPITPAKPDNLSLYDINIPISTISITKANPKFTPTIDFVNKDNAKNFCSNVAPISKLIDYKTTCDYDIVGYVITKLKGNRVIKRIYILNDKLYTGYLKYFDSQIIEEEEYTYKIEQINNIYGVKYSINASPNRNPTFYKSGATPKQKDVFIQKQQELTLDEAFGPANQVTFSSKEDETLLPFYKNKPLSINTFFDFNLKQMVAYSPISKISETSPDITVKTKNTSIPPSIPDMKIYGRKGDSKNVLIVLSNLISKKADITSAVDKTDIIELGASIKQQQFSTKEFRVFRSEVTPMSYESFSKTPRKTLDPKFPDFVDSIEPNTIYYYYAEAIDSKNTSSGPSQILKLEMVEEQNHVFPLIEVYNFGENKEIITEKMFKRLIRVSPTFLQSAVGPSGIVGEYIQQKLNDGYNNKLFLTKVDVVGTSEPFPTHKIRVTSKKTRRRFDINTIFSFENVKEFKSLPEGAILVLEEDMPKSP